MIARARRRAARRTRRRPCAHRQHRARPVPARRVEHRGTRRRRVLPARPPRRCRRACASPSRHDVPFVARGAGTGLAGGATPLDDAVVIVAHQDEPGPVGRSGQPAGVGRAGRAQPRPHPRRSRISACTSPPTRAASRAAAIGGNVANNSGGPHCLADGVTAAHVLGARGRARRRLGRRARRRGAGAGRATTCAARSSAARACSASPPRSACGSPRTRRRCARC